MSTKSERVADIFMATGLDVSNQLVISRYEARHDGTVSIDVVRKVRKQFEEAVPTASEEETMQDETITEEPQDAPEATEETIEDEGTQEAAEEPTAPFRTFEDDEVKDGFKVPNYQYDNGVTEPETPKAEETPAPEPEVVISRVPEEGRCNHRMVRALDLCGRPEGHPGVHTTYAQMEKKKAFSKARASARYHSDPAYKERVKAASRQSHQKSRNEAKAIKEKIALATANAEANGTTVGEELAKLYASA